jgi:hypothetical protein
MTNKLKTTVRFFSKKTSFLGLALLFCLTAISCDKLRNLQTEQIIEAIKNSIQDSIPAFYIVGYDACPGVYIQNGTAKSRGYVLVSENLEDTLLTYNLPDNLFIFPAEIMPGDAFGLDLFPQEYRFTYKVQMNYVPMTEEEILGTFAPCITLYEQKYYFVPTFIVINRIFKTQ